MEVYAFIVTVILIIAIFLALKWKLIAYAVTMFCVEKFRKPTEKEIADYTKRVISKSLKKN